MKKLYLLLAGSAMIIILSGCSVVGSLEQIGCNFVSGKTQDHCYQDAAVRKLDYELCAKIKAEDFSALQGPAPRDKCYLRVAEGTGDASGCENIVGGMISYSKAECVQAAAKTAQDPSICDQITEEEDPNGTQISACIQAAGGELNHK